MIYQYIVEWQGRGFYAKSQPSYHWCFTNDITKAATYKSEKAAVERACGTRYGSGHNNKPYRIVKVDGNFNVIDAPEAFQTKAICQNKPMGKDKPISLAQILGSSQQREE